MTNVVANAWGFCAFLVSFGCDARQGEAELSGANAFVVAPAQAGAQCLYPAVRNDAGFRPTPE
jgi:hypothetical protein